MAQYRIAVVVGSIRKDSSYFPQLPASRSRLYRGCGRQTGPYFLDDIAHQGKPTLWFT